MTVIDIWSRSPKTMRDRHMEVLKQVDWEAHRRDNCAAANWAASELIRMQRRIDYLEAKIRKFESNK